MNYEGQYVEGAVVGQGQVIEGAVVTQGEPTLAAEGGEMIYDGANTGEVIVSEEVVSEQAVEASNVESPASETPVSAPATGDSVPSPPTSTEGDA